MDDDEDILELYNSDPEFGIIPFVNFKNYKNIFDNFDR
jgi:hypothetical protein